MTWKESGDADCICVAGVGNWGKTRIASHNKTVIQTLGQRRSTRLLEGTLRTGGGRSRIAVPADGEER